MNVNEERLKIVKHQLQQCKYILCNRKQNNTRQSQNSNSNISISVQVRQIMNNSSLCGILLILHFISLFSILVLVPIPVTGGILGEQKSVEKMT